MEVRNLAKHYSGLAKVTNLIHYSPNINFALIEHTPLLVYMFIYYIFYLSVYLYINIYFCQFYLSLPLLCWCISLEVVQSFPIIFFTDLFVITWAVTNSKSVAAHRSLLNHFGLFWASFWWCSSNYLELLNHSSQRFVKMIFVLLQCFIPH